MCISLISIVCGWQFKNCKCKIGTNRQLIFTVVVFSLLQLVYCLAHFTGDDKVPPYVNRLVNPGIVTEERNDDDQVLSSLYHDYDEEDYLNLLKKDTEALFQDSTYMKHLRRHANK